MHFVIGRWLRPDSFVSIYKRTRSTKEAQASLLSQNGTTHRLFATGNYNLLSPAQRSTTERVRRALLLATMESTQVAHVMQYIQSHSHRDELIHTFVWKVFFSPKHGARQSRSVFRLSEYKTQHPDPGWKKWNNAQASAAFSKINIHAELKC